MPDYNLAKLLSLCKEICLQDEIITELPIVWDILDMAAISPHIPALTSSETAQTAHDALTKIFYDTDPNGYKMLISQLLAALHTREIYKQKRIDDQIFIDTIKCFSRFTGENFVSFGQYGFNRGWWTHRQLSAKIFRLGALEFEIEKDILSVHIPSDAVMTAEALDYSYSSAESFFAKLGVKYTGIYCTTWLLCPTLKNILPSSSRILTFQNDYEIISMNPDSTSFMSWVYKKDYPNLAQLPEDTRLQQELKKLLLAGGSLGDAHGRYKGSDA